MRKSLEIKAKLALGRCIIKPGSEVALKNRGSVLKQTNYNTVI